MKTKLVRSLFPDSRRRRKADRILVDHPHWKKSKENIENEI